MSKSIERDEELMEKLLRMVKREVKQIMEEAVTRKFVHEDSSSITSLCAAVDACLSNGLKRRALGLFKTSSTTALLQKVAKNCEAATLVMKKVNEIENCDPNKRSSSSNDSLSKTRMSFKIKSTTTGSTNTNSSIAVSPKIRYLWIRIALFEKHLVSIVDHVVQNSFKYYERDALVSDPVAGQILASLLVGPCALDYTRMKTQDPFWTDPPADELVKRHRISSNMVSQNSPVINQSTPPSNRKSLGMSYRKNIVLSNGTDEESSGSPVSRTPRICWSPRDYVESLHQNSKSILLYGKNNVIMQPMNDLEPMPGYLSLHQDSGGLIVKWTPNKLINGRGNNSNEMEETTFNQSIDKNDGNVFWNFALNVRMENIVYLHCHQQKFSCGSIVMVGRDGVMHSPIKFPKGGHLLSFLSCLETGLMPYGQLDPPLWSEKGKGKVFPKLKRKSHSSTESFPENSFEDKDDIASDYVFRVISIYDKPDSISPELFEPRAEKVQEKNDRKSDYSIESNGSLSLSQENETKQDTLKNEVTNVLDDEKKNLQVLCNTMRKQIISRAFYGWLAFCRHLKTVRTHLTDLVNSKIVLPNKPNDANQGIDKAMWDKIRNEQGQIIVDKTEFHRLIYYGGIEHSIRIQVWLYLLEHYKFKDTEEDRKQHDLETRKRYEMVMSEWLAIEAIVRQRDKEIVAANLAKLSSESNNTNPEVPYSFEKSIMLLSAKSASNDVFDNDDLLETHLIDSRRSSETNNTDVSSASRNTKKTLFRHKQVESVASMFGASSSSLQNIFITNPSIDQNNSNLIESGGLNDEILNNDLNSARLPVSSIESAGSQCVSPASSNGGLYSNELLDLFSLNLHRIDKDVQRCDRNFWYFSKQNLEKLRNVMCTYVWDNLDIGYVQGMCDLVAPLLVIFDDEVYTYSCFCILMKRMASNFPHGGAMDTHFANMRSLIQILDADLFELMHQNGDYTHFYFCYRWFLLDFKRELIYDDVFSVWETIWAAKHVSSSSFVLFIALALVEYYREIILENNMDFTDIIKFFNEMAERHDAKAVLIIARDLVHQIQTMIQHK